eukprot:CAMPEP_0117437606 /NCGR_PEP_ID=MMETSP0759-20121206/1611_1 /TAXON_ID=63605 /ORGANISM="Percolomonas cosmopolitus, Strain WS" /LENGTH=232 /DNA_ID=CAMNT_0005229245 /DNA_START=123 /DNA_END=821 /DNA_ORIENTATION=-
MQQIMKSHLKHLTKADKMPIYQSRFTVTCLNPQFRVRMLDHYYLGNEEDFATGEKAQSYDEMYESLTLGERRFSRRVSNEEILIQEALSDEAEDMVDEVALGDTVQLIFRIKTLKEYPSQQDLSNDQFPSEIDIVDVKVEKRISTFQLAYQTIFDPLSYLTVILGFSLFIMLSGWYHKGFMWRWGLGGLLVSVGLAYWLWVQWKDFMDSYKCLKRDVRVHKDSKFFEDKKGQ